MFNDKAANLFQNYNKNRTACKYPSNTTYVPGNFAQAASNNILFPSSINSSKTPKPPKPPKPLPGSQTFLTVTAKVSGGTKKPSDFTTSVSGDSSSPNHFQGHQLVLL